MSSELSSSPSVQELARLVAALSSELEALRIRVETLETLVGPDSDTFQIIPPTVETTGATTAEAGYRVGERREQIARGIGHWVQRALAGRHRGSSGRAEIGLASRLYLVFKDVDNVLHNPPQVFYSWQSAKGSCARQGDAGDAVFVGLPTKTEAEIVIRSAGLEVPPDLRRA